MLIDGREKSLAWDFEFGKRNLKVTQNRFCRLKACQGKSREIVESKVNTSEVCLVFLFWYLKLVRLVFFVLWGKSLAVSKWGH